MAKPSTSLTDSFRTLKDNLNTVSNNVGDPANLLTTADSDLVGAINELYASSGGADSSIGTLSNLTTTAKNNLVAAINEIDSDLGALNGASAADVGDINLLNDSYYAGADSNLVSALNKIYDAQWEKYRSVTEYGVVAGDSSLGAANSAALKVAISDNYPLFWPAGVYYFAEQIRMNQTSFNWKGSGNRTVIVPTLSFTDSSLMRFEVGNNSKADNDSAVDKLINCHMEGFVFNAGGLVNGSATPVTSIRQGWYINWMHQSTFDNIVFQNFNSTDSAYAIRIMAHNDKTNSGGAFGMNVRMSNFELTYNANGIQNGGLAPSQYLVANGGDDDVTATGDCNASQFSNIRIGGTTHLSPSGRVGTGFHLKQGYDNTLSGLNVEIQQVGIRNRNYNNYIVNSLSEQVGDAVKTDSGHLNILHMNSLPNPVDQDYHYLTHLSWRGWNSQMASLGSPENLIIDGTFETNLYESATLGASIIPVDGGSNTTGATGRNVLYLPVTANPADITYLLKPNKKKLRGWHTFLVRAKRAVQGTNSTLFTFVTSSDYTAQVGLSQGGSGSDTGFLEVGEFKFTNLRNSTYYLADEWKIFMAAVNFDDVDIEGFNGRALNGGAYVDWIALYEGTVAAIPQASTEFEVSTDVVWGGGGGIQNTSIIDMKNAGTTAKPLHAVADFLMYESHYDSDGESLHAAFQVINGEDNYMAMGGFGSRTGRYYNGFDFADSDSDTANLLTGNPRSIVYLDNTGELFYTTYAGATVLPTQRAVARIKLLPNSTTI